MTPEEKAKELVGLMLQHQMIIFDENYSLNNAKQCASICVVEIIKSLNNIEGQHSTIYEEEDFYREVKTEINKL